MKRKAISLLLLMVALTACGQTTPVPSESSQPSNIEIPASPEASESNSESESGVPESTVENIVDQIVTSTPTPSSEDSEKITNNGNHFVQIGDSIYFRIPSKEAMNTGAIYGEYLDGIPGSTLVSYNLTTGEMTELTSDNGYGKLYVTNGSMLVTSSMDDETRTYSMLEGIKLKNLSVTEYEGQSYLGIDSSGEYVVIADYDYTEYHPRFIILQNGKVYDEISSSQLYNYVGFCDKTLLYITHKDSENYYLVSHNLETGEEITLGKLPLSEYEYAPGMPEQLLVQGSTFYLSLAYYEGTGHYYAGATLLTGDVHTEGSLVEKYLEATDEEFPSHAPRFTVNVGNINPADGIPGTAEVNGDTGEIGYFAEDGSWTPVLRGFASNYSSDYETGTAVEVVEYVNGKLFLVQNELEHTPEEDIGWRTAYRRTRTVIQMIDTVTGAVTTLADIDNP